MMDRRIPIAVVAVVAVAALFFVLRPEDDGEATPTRTVTTATSPTESVTTNGETEPAAAEPVRASIRVIGGDPVGGLTRIQAREGDRIVLIVRADAPEHVHVHGYDLVADVGPGRPASMRFRATLTGRFEIELENSHRQIAQLTVLP
jgi:hypothetical protein